MGMKTVLMKCGFNFTKEETSQRKRNKMIDDFVYLWILLIHYWKLGIMNILKR